MNTLLFILAFFISSTCFSQEYVGNMLDRVNEMREKYNLEPFLPDENLQREAEDITLSRCSRGKLGHLIRRGLSPLSYGGKTYSTHEGVGWYSDVDFDGEYFIACYLYDNFTYCGAAVCVRDDGTTYYSLRLR